MVTTLDVRDAVIGALNGAYPNVPVYVEETQQERVKPYMFLKEFPVSQSRIMGKRYVRGHSFDVQYFPSAAKPNEEAHAIAEKLFELLEYIPLGSGQMRGTGMRFEVTDGMLHFFFNVNLQVIKQTVSAPKMASAEVEEWVK